MSLRSHRLPRRTAILLATACGALALAVPASAANPTYLDPHASVQARVADLLKQMTTEEKVGQLEQIAVTRLEGSDCTWSGGALNTTCLSQVFDTDKTGSILSGGGMTPASNTPKDWAIWINTIQQYAIQHSRLHIPIEYGADAVHGHNNVLGATIFPQQIGVGATWDTTLARQLGQSTQKAVAATGVTWDFAPVADISRDQRWGRYYETYSEDPLLSGSLASSTITGLQDKSSGKQIAATVKHFAGYSQPFNGHDRAPSDYSQRYLQDTILPSYQQAVASGSLTVMANSGAINGVPVTASHYLLTDVLRGQWHFQGLVVSDWNDVKNLQSAYHIVPDYASAIAAAVNAGVDLAMVPPDDRTFHQSAMDAVNRGLISPKRLDEAVGRNLAIKFQLGLFEHPYVDPDKANAAVLGADTALARQAATESSVLLRNQNSTLPLAAGKHIVVTGPNADSVTNQDGGWTIGWQGIPAGTNEPGVTIQQGLKNNAPAGTTVTYDADSTTAVTDAKSADAVVVVVGNGAGAEGPNDQPKPELAADQQALVSSLSATGKPVIVVVVADRPLVLGSAATTAGLLMAWEPGAEGGDAVADILYGTANPSGRLPVSWPKDIGNEPEFYQQLPGTNGGTDSGYSPLFPFGAGLSYTTYSFGTLTASASKDHVSLSVTVSNTGAVAGDLVVPVYVSQPVSQLLVPPKRLVAFARVHLGAGQQHTVQLSIPTSQLALTAGDVNGGTQKKVEPGDYQFSAGDLSAAAGATVTLH